MTLDPHLNQLDLQKLAAERPDLHGQILQHSQCYPDLAQWIQSVNPQAAPSNITVADAMWPSASTTPVLKARKSKTIIIALVIFILVAGSTIAFISLLYSSSPSGSQGLSGLGSKLFSSEVPKTRTYEKILGEFTLPEGHLISVTDDENPRIATTNAGADENNFDTHFYDISADGLELVAEFERMYVLALSGDHAVARDAITKDYFVLDLTAQERKRLDVPFESPFISSSGWQICKDTVLSVDSPETIFGFELSTGKIRWYKDSYFENLRFEQPCSYPLAVAKSLEEKDVLIGVDDGFTTQKTSTYLFEDGLMSTIFCNAVFYSKEDGEFESIEREPTDNCEAIRVNAKSVYKASDILEKMTPKLPQSWNFLDIYDGHWVGVSTDNVFQLDGKEYPSAADLKCSIESAICVVYDGGNISNISGFYADNPDEILWSIEGYGTNEAGPYLLINNAEDAPGEVANSYTIVGSD